MIVVLPYNSPARSLQAKSAIELAEQTHGSKIKRLMLAAAKSHE
jgi:hypothetical protein